MVEQLGGALGVVYAVIDMMAACSAASIEKKPHRQPERCRAVAMRAPSPQMEADITRIRYSVIHLLSG